MNISAQIRRGGGQQEGINMVDLMMWLVIAALLLAAAIQGIGYYQKAAYLYQIQSDLEGVGTYTTGIAANNNNGVIDEALADKGVTEANKTAGVVTTAELAADGKTPYLRGVHPGVSDKDVLYLFDSCNNTYKIGVNVVAKGSVPDFSACGISASSSGGATGGTSGTSGTTGGTGTTSGTTGGTGGTTGGTGGTGTTTGGAFQLAAWGGNSYGQFGDGTTTSNYTSTLISGMTFSTIDAGNGHVCGISNGNAYCWGSNGSGQLGIGNQTNVSTPTPVGGVLAGKTVTDISAGPSHSCAISDQAVYCWGYNGYGQANGTVDTTTPVSYVTSPVLVNNGAIAGVKMKTVDADGQRTCAVDISGNAYCWGNDQALGSGNPRDGSNWSAPIAVAGGLTFTSKITGSDSHACGIAGGDAYCWGINDSGSVGNGGADRAFNASPSKVIGLPAGKVTNVSSGDTTTCAIADGGKGYCWGANWGGQIGDGTGNDSYTAVAVDTSGVLNGVSLASMSSYMDMTCAASTNAVYCWGEGPGGDGQSYNDYYSPVTATGAIVGKNIQQVVLGNYFTSMLVQ